MTLASKKEFQVYFLYNLTNTGNIYIHIQTNAHACTHSHSLSFLLMHNKQTNIQMYIHTYVHISMHIYM